MPYYNPGLVGFILYQLWICLSVYFSTFSTATMAAPLDPPYDSYNPDQYAFNTSCLDCFYM